jgi:hypothetical protein
MRKKQEPEWLNTKAADMRKAKAEYFYARKRLKIIEAIISHPDFDNYGAIEQLIIKRDYVTTERECSELADFIRSQ